MGRLRIAIAGGLLAVAPAAAYGAGTGGGAPAFPTPAIASIACRVDCVDARTARPGSYLRVKGRAMRRVRTVVFIGGRGPRDDAAAPVAQATPRSVVVRVPAGARSGRLRVRDADGVLSPPSRATIAVGDRAAAAGSGPPLGDTSDHVFPVAGPHGYGGEAARFGAGRSGHAHQGQDIPAACGTPVVAAHGGLVRFRAFHARAGNYVVIAGERTGADSVYMHLREPALARRGEHVAAGQRIGAVGDTGRASGCHLHFELWTAPGWYEGGRPIDPLSYLRAWDGAATAAVSR
jgi:murein DD-endopeptidase MepM/ murein hydrolase activator NlpD